MLPVTLHGHLPADLDGENNRDVAANAGVYSALVVSLANKPSMGIYYYFLPHQIERLTMMYIPAAWTLALEDLAAELNRPLDNIWLLIRRYLHDQIYPNNNLPVANVGIDDLPFISNYSKIRIFKYAHTAFYVLSEEAGPWGMHAEVIRCNPLWYGQYDH